MLSVGLAAPQFTGSAVVEGCLVRLSWQQLHDNKTLVLLFAALDAQARAAANLIAVGNAVTQSGRPRARLAVVCRNDLDEALAWVNRPRPEGDAEAPAFPLILDPDGRIGGLYDMSSEGRGPVWGQFLIDPSGVLRQAVCSAYPVRPSAEELLRAIRASGFPAETELWN